MKVLSAVLSGKMRNDVNTWNCARNAEMNRSPADAPCMIEN